MKRISAGKRKRATRMCNRAQARADQQSTGTDLRKAAQSNATPVEILESIARNPRVASYARVLACKALLSRAAKAASEQVEPASDHQRRDDRDAAKKKRIAERTLTILQGGRK